MVHRHLLVKCLDKVIDLETGQGSIYKGRITDFDEWGINFVPDDKKLKPAIISWGDVRKLILAEESNAPVKRTWLL